VPGHTQGSIVCYYQKEKAVLTDDFIDECGHAVNLIDWLPTSSVRDYLRSSNRMLDWLQEADIEW
jgi:glyoxylase-like metal-dependent hydrolase (beta-lactamase superfamily II)